MQFAHVQMESSVTGESQDPEADSAEQGAFACQEDGLATAVAHAAGALMADFLDPSRLQGTGPCANCP